MAMFSFDEQAALFDVTPLPNQFILNYLPEASGDAVRVYLCLLYTSPSPRDRG